MDACSSHDAPPSAQALPDYAPGSVHQCGIAAIATEEDGSGAGDGDCVGRRHRSRLVLGDAAGLTSLVV